MRTKLYKAGDNPIGYYITHVENIQPNIITRKIEYITFPRHFRRIIGIAFTASVNGLSTQSYQLGIITIHFNNSKSYSHFSVHDMPIGAQTSLLGFFDFDEQIIPGSPVILQYKETSGLAPAFFPYQVNIVFKTSIK